MLRNKFRDFSIPRLLFFTCLAAVRVDLLSSVNMCVKSAACMYVKHLHNFISSEDCDVQMQILDIENTWMLRVRHKMPVFIYRRQKM